MKKHATDAPKTSRVAWEQLEEWVSHEVQRLIQEILEEEVTEFLGRVRSQRRQAVDGSPGYRNRHGKERRLTLKCGTVTLRRPRVRGLEERFTSRLLPLFVRRTQEVADLVPELYLHGLALGEDRLSREELERLAALKVPLVQVRGQWVELRSLFIIT